MSKSPLNAFWPFDLCSLHGFLCVNLCVMFVCDHVMQCATVPADQGKGHSHSSQQTSFACARVYTNINSQNEKHLLFLLRTQRDRAAWRILSDTHTHTKHFTDSQILNSSSVNALLLLLVRAEKRAGRLVSSIWRMAKLVCVERGTGNEKICFSHQETESGFPAFILSRI